MKKMKSIIRRMLLKFSGLDQQISDLQSQIKQKDACIKQFVKYQIHCQEDYPTCFPLVLTDNEKSLLKKYLSLSKYYLEFGSGGSTFLAVLCSNTKVYSVESDDNWIKYLSSWKVIKDSIHNKRLKFFYANIGAVKEWGIPINNDLKDVFYKYSSDVFKNENVCFDTVFVDGRFRVACVLKSILECSEDVSILIHDYSMREEYHIIERYLDKVEDADSLFVFRKKSNIDYDELKLCYEKYKDDWH